MWSAVLFLPYPCWRFNYFCFHTSCVFFVVVFNHPIIDIHICFDLSFIPHSGFSAFAFFFFFFFTFSCASSFWLLSTLLEDYRFLMQTRQGPCAAERMDDPNGCSSSSKQRHTVRSGPSPRQWAATGMEDRFATWFWLGEMLNRIGNHLLHSYRHVLPPQVIFLSVVAQGCIYFLSVLPWGLSVTVCIDLSTNTNVHPCVTALFADLLTCSCLSRGKHGATACLELARGGK